MYLRPSPCDTKVRVKRLRACCRPAAISCMRTRTRNSSVSNGSRSSSSSPCAARAASWNAQQQRQQRALRRSLGLPACACRKNRCVAARVARPPPQRRPKFRWTTRRAASRARLSDTTGRGVSTSVAMPARAARARAPFCASVSAAVDRPPCSLSANVCASHATHRQVRACAVVTVATSAPSTTQRPPHCETCTAPAAAAGGHLALRRGATSSKVRTCVQCQQAFAQAPRDAHARRSQSRLVAKRTSSGVVLRARQGAPPHASHARACPAPHTHVRNSPASARRCTPGDAHAAGCAATPALRRARGGGREAWRLWAHSVPHSITQSSVESEVTLPAALDAGI